jgi:hypothetical protein
MLVFNNANVGCTISTFCPDLYASRAQAANMIITALLGDNFSYQQAPYFTDVPVSHPFFKYIQKMKELGITAGCTPTAFCPNDSITRGQMATFIIRAKLRASNSELVQPAYPASAFFNDVSSFHMFYPYIQKMKNLGLTSGCTVTDYCPEGTTTRGELAAFISRTLYVP